ncbi:MAG: EVE domain-containing protein [Leptospiraceae bacterium]|nr:EVE domain-containing protein [Leptospiraceae bacterium]
MDIIRIVREKTTKSVYEISYDAWTSYTNKADKPNYWIFQGNPKIFNIVEALKNNAIETWSVRAHKSEIKKDDKVILWVTGEAQGCYALAEVTSNVYEGRDEKSQMKYYTDKSVDEISSRVKLQVTHNLVDAPISKPQIDSNPELSELNVGSQGTNFSATEEEYNAIIDLIEEAKNSFSKTLSLFPKEDLDFYFKFLKEILNHFQLKIGDERLSFSCKRDRLSFIVGQRYGWNLFYGDSRGKYGVITSEKIIGIKHSEPFDGNPPQPYFNRFHDIDIVESNKPTMFDAIDKELKRTSKSSFRRFHDTNFENASYEMNTKMNPTQQKDNNMKPLSLNTIFYGPPGTGKTYHTILRAAEIIENKKISDYKEAQRIFNANLGDRIEFITFHQNYSYEDFIQGLRPNVESEGNLSFERKDGVFKRIAVNALFEYYKVRKKQSASKKDKEQKLDENEIYLDFVEHLKSLKSKEFKTSTGSVITISSFTKNDNIEFKHENRSRGYTVSGNRLLKLFEIFPTMQKIKNVHEDIRDAIGGCNTTVYWVALREFIQFYNTYKKNPEIELADEVDEEVSYDTKKKLLANLDFENFKEVKSFDVPSYVIIIDEINRANISRVFGELITLIEPDKRSHGKIPLRCTLPSGEEFIVPSNLFIIGAMNTADKSIALLDIALRRRFVFEAMYPLYEIAGEEIFHKEVLKKLNAEIVNRKGHDFQIGHSYFMGDNKDLPEIMNRKVIPLLLEYFMNDETEVTRILKKAGLVVKKDSWPLEIQE